MPTLMVKIRPEGDEKSELVVERYEVPEDDLPYLDTLARVNTYAGSRWPSDYELVDWEIEQ